MTTSKKHLSSNSHLFTGPGQVVLANKAFKSGVNQGKYQVRVTLNRLQEAQVRKDVGVVIAGMS